MGTGNIVQIVSLTNQMVMQKKALIAANYLGFIGFLWNDINILRSKDYAIDFIGYDKDGSEEKKIGELLSDKEICFYNIPFDSKNPFSSVNIRAYKSISDLLQANRYELIHCHTPIVGLLVRLAASKYRFKGSIVVYTTHGLAFTHLSNFKTKALYKTLEWIMSFFTDAVITINKEDYAAMMKMHAKNVFYINGVGVNCSKYCNVTIDRNLYRKQIGVASSDIMILSVGELSNRKNHEAIIRAIGLMHDKNKYVYVIAGKGMGVASTEDTLIQTAKQHDVRLILLGFRDDIPQLIHCSDIGAIPSIREGLGLAGIQSLCAGVPLVGSDVQGIKDYIVDGVTGYLCNPFDYIAFMRNIKKLSDASNRYNMNLHCHSMAMQFDIAVSKNQMRNIYDIILEKE